MGSALQYNLRSNYSLSMILPILATPPQTGCWAVQERDACLLGIERGIWIVNGPQSRASAALLPVTVPPARFSAVNG